MKLYFSLLLVLASLTMSEGQPTLQLSEKHLQKVVEQDNPVKKRKAYLKYYHKDSVRYVKEVDRYWQAKFDSATTFIPDKREKVRQGIDRLLNEELESMKRLMASTEINAEMYRLPAALEGRYSQKQLQSIYSSARYYLVEMAKDSAGSLSEIIKIDRSFMALLDPNKQPGVNLTNPVNNAGRFGKKLKGELNEKLGKNNYIKEAKEIKGDVGLHLVEFRQYEQYANMTPDSLLKVGESRLEKEVQNQMMAAAGFEGYQKQLNQYNQLQSQYKGYLNDLQDSTARKEMAKKKAEELAMQYINDNPSIMKSVQKKMDLLMKKYSYVSNSNDLSTAVKRTSLRGRTFRERLVVAANFQVLSIDPVTVDLSPQIGYRFNSLLSAGIGGTYRQTFKDTIPSLSPEVFGYKGFVSYDVVKSFFAYGEYAQNSPGVKVEEGISKRIWNPAALLGVGRKFSVSKKIDMTVVALYNFIHKPGDTLYPRPFMVRVGFQLSDIALFKKKPDTKLF